MKGSGWHGEPRRHSLARQGIKTVLPDGRRLSVNKFVAKGKEDYDVLEKKYLDIAYDNAPEILRRLLKGNYGDKVLIFEDGTISETGSGSRPITDMDYIELGSVGWVNMDSSRFIEGWAHERDDGVYVEDETGRIIGGWDEVVDETIEYGDISGEIDDLLYRVELAVESAYGRKDW